MTDFEQAKRELTVLLNRNKNLAELTYNSAVFELEEAKHILSLSKQTQNRLNKEIRRLKLEMAENEELNTMLLEYYKNRKEENKGIIKLYTTNVDEFKVLCNTSKEQLDVYNRIIYMLNSYGIYLDKVAISNEDVVLSKVDKDKKVNNLLSTVSNEFPNITEEQKSWLFKKFSSIV